MFYCDKCKEEHDFPASIMMSTGKCEMCGTHARCYDVPSKHLPKIKDTENPTSLDDFLLLTVDEMKSFSHTSQIVLLAKIAQRLSLDKTAAAIRDSLNK
jgi:hypothetical protein